MPTIQASQTSEIQTSLFEPTSPAQEWAEDSPERALDELFTAARRYRTGAQYRELLNFITEFDRYSPFNAMLVHLQMPGAAFVAPATRWRQQFRRRVKANSRPLVIMQPGGPVMFVFDVSDTEPEPGAPDLPLTLPETVTAPFGNSRAIVDLQDARTVENAKRDGIEVMDKADGNHSAGFIRQAPPGKQLRVRARVRPTEKFVHIPVAYEVVRNSKHPSAVRYATLVHELAHLYCGHLGSPNPEWWPDRDNLDEVTMEFEAESVAYLVLKRLGVHNPSERYLGGYLSSPDKPIPEISLDCVMRTTGLIESMGRRRLPLRTKKQPGNKEA